MFYISFGADSDKARAHAKGVIAAMKKKRPDAEYFRVTADLWDSAVAEQLLGGQGLFDQKCIVFFDGILENTEAKEWIASRAGDFGKSENAFVFLERVIDAPTAKKFEKSAQEIKKFESEAKTFNRFGKGEFNTFALADALGERNKKQLWILLSEAFMKGITPEEIGGVLSWQTKSMLAAQNAKNASESGLKPFVFMKSRKYSDNYSTDELLTLSRNLLSIYHDSHRGLRDFSSALERFALSL